MRAEDLFEAIGGLDEQLIALSEEDSLRAREAGTRKTRTEESRRIQKRRKRAAIYRYAAIAMTTAAAVFIMLTAKDFLGTRNRSYTQSAAESAQYSMDNGAAEEALAGGAVESEASLAAAEPRAEAARSAEAESEAAAKDRAAQDFDTEAEAGPETEAAIDSAPAAAAGPATGSQPAEESAEKNAAQAVEESAEEIASLVTEEAAQDLEKSAVDILGDLKGDYVRLEIISAEDLAAGGERKVPEYSKEREEALTSALQNGQKMPVFLVKKGNPLFYVYLTKSTGSVDTVIFYENGYVGIDTIPGFVMKLSDKAFEDVKELFN